LQRRHRIRRDDDVEVRSRKEALPLTSLFATHQFKTLAKISGATIVASDSIMNLGVCSASLPQLIFSLGTAPE
jgi:hypothetical protein